MKIKAIATAATIGISFIATNPLQAQGKHTTKWNDQSRISEVTCDGLATFTLGINQKPSSSDLPSLCRCLVRETNQRGWEVDVLKKIQSGIEPSFIEKHGKDVVNQGITLDRLTEPKDISPIISLIVLGKMDHSTGSTIDVNGGSFLR